MSPRSTRSKTRLPRTSRSRSHGSSPTQCRGHLCNADSCCILPRNNADPSTVILNNFLDGQSRDLAHVGFCIHHQMIVPDEWRLKVVGGLYCTTPRCVHGAHSGLVHQDSNQPLSWREYRVLGFDIKRSTELFPCVPSVAAFELWAGEPGGQVSLLADGTFLVRISTQPDVSYIITRELRRIG